MIDYGSRSEEYKRNLSIGNAHIEIDGVICGPNTSFTVERLGSLYYIGIHGWCINATTLSCLMSRSNHRMKATHRQASTEDEFTFSFNHCVLNKDKSQSVGFGNTNAILEIELNFQCDVDNSDFETTPNTQNGAT